MVALVALGVEEEVEDESPELKSSTVTLKQGGFSVKSLTSTKVYEEIETSVNIFNFS